MKNLKKASLGLLALTLLSLSSCASYKASPLYHPISETYETPKSKSDVLILSKLFNKKDCKKFLDRDVLAEGYQPVQIYIENNSDTTYIFSLNRINLPLAPAKQVAETVHTSTVGRAAGYGAGALIFWPLAIPAIVDGVKSSKANQALDSDFAAKTAKNQEIPPHSHLNTIVFVPLGAYHEPFNLTLIDKNTQQLKTFQLYSKKWSYEHN